MSPHKQMHDYKPAPFRRPPEGDIEPKLHAYFAGSGVTERTIEQCNNVLLLYDDESSEDGTNQLDVGELNLQNA